MKKIPLTQGKYALVDDADYECLKQFNWRIRITGRQVYAIRDLPKHKGKRRTMPIQRFLLNAHPPLYIDHINSDGLDNRRSNLRICTKQQNNMNQRPQVGKSSVYKGVTWRTRDKIWAAQIHINKKTIHLGHFKLETDAARAYNEAAKIYFGEFAKLNDLDALAKEE